MLFPCSIRVHARWRVDGWTGPGWKLLQRHDVYVEASPSAALHALGALRIEELPAVRALLTLRRLRFTPKMTVLEFFSTPPFTMLEVLPSEEMIGGILLPARSADGVRRQPGSVEEFRRALETAPVAAVASFRADPRGSTGTRLATETFVRTRGTLPGVLFGAYWLAIGPFSGWIRRMLLAAARWRAEPAAAAAGPAARHRLVRR